MSNFVQDAEQSFDGNNDQQQGNQGGDFGQDQQNNDQQNNNQQSGGGGGFMSDVKQGGEDAAINTEVNKFATKEGLPQGGDGALDAVVDEGANKYL